jgi:hypothetical protein
MSSGSKYLRPGRDFSFTVSTSRLKKALQANFTLSGVTDMGKAVEMRIENKTVKAFSFQTNTFKVELNHKQSDDLIYNNHFRQVHYLMALMSSRSMSTIQLENRTTKTFNP